ncbi:MAG TPA: helix-turn-helix domain-containing protein [Chthoniobacter sp.]|jgi:DNA-binding transcriptional regulator YiaG
MKTAQTTEMVDFEVLIPTVEGNEIADRITIKIPVIRDATGEEILTPEAHELIEQTQARYTGLMLPDQLRALRNRLGLTQRNLGELLQVGEKSYTRWESGRARPSRSINVLLCALRDGRLSVSYLQGLQKPIVDWWNSAHQQPVVVGFSNRNDSDEMPQAA